MKIYLIGGPPKCGKTTLAKTLSKKLSIPWISADTLQNIVYKYTDRKNVEKHFPHSYSKGGNNDETYSQNSTNSIVKNYVKQGKTCHKAISIVVKTQIIDKDDYIIEGYQVTPEIVDELIKEFGRDKIRTIFLVKHDEKEFVKNIHKSTTPNDWIIEKTKDKNTFFKIAEMVALYSKYFESEAKKNNLTVLEMDHDFEKQIVTAIKILTESI
jgi:2-phosphoglycerate kinase